MTPRRKALPIKSIVAAYKAGESTTSIAKRYQVAPATIGFRLHEAGVVMRRRGPGPLERLPMDKVAAGYRQGESSTVLGRRYGVTGTTILRRLAAHGVKLRRTRVSGATQRGDLPALASDLGRTEQEVRDLLLRHGFIN